MAFNVDNFIGSISRFGVMQTNKFEVRMNLPNLLRGNPRYSELGRLLADRAQDIRVPGVVIDTYENRRYGTGPKQKTASNIAFNDIGITFLETSENEIYKFFYDWTNLIFDFSGDDVGGETAPSFTAQYRDNYTTDIDIYVYNNTGRSAAGPFISPSRGTVAGTEVTVTATEVENMEPVSVIKLFEAYPVSVSDVDMGWSNNNALYRVGVSIAFSRWRISQYERTIDLVGPQLPI